MARDPPETREAVAQADQRDADKPAKWLCAKFWRRRSAWLPPPQSLRKNSIVYDSYVAGEVEHSGT
jgi:hypothetical protein